jgi:asparagine synthase (glutamine-hydrolysing)
MTTTRFAAWMMKSRPCDHAGRVHFAQSARAKGLTVSVTDDGLLVAASGAASATTSAILVGELFDRATGNPLSGRDIAALLARPEANRRIVEQCWGDYIMFHADAEASMALRAPFGDVPCYWSDLGDRVVVASTIELLRCFGAPSPAVDCAEVARFLTATDYRGGATCLAGIAELQGGEALQVSDKRVTTRWAWSPWALLPGSRRSVKTEAAAARVRDAVVAAVEARASGSAPVILLMSGGLDSSIVAAALAHAGRSALGLTMVTDDADGDERAYARAVAEQLGIPLTEARRALADVDLARPLSPRLPRPTGRPFAQSTDAAVAALAGAHGVEVAMNGGGGDNMFCSLQSPAPLLDRIACEGLGRGAWATLRDTAELANVSVGAVARAAMHRRLSRGPAFRWPLDRSFLNQGRDLEPTGMRSHHWLAPPAGALPGECAQVALLLAAKALVENVERDQHPFVRSPLVAQPVAEAVLAAPSWLWLERGRNRAVARRAFADTLPGMVIDRRSKGTAASFMSQIVESRRTTLRDLLLGGLLAQNQVFDTAAVTAWLEAAGPARDLGFARILQLADAEAWARSWTAR